MLASRRRATLSISPHEVFVMCCASMSSLVVSIVEIKADSASSSYSSHESSPLMEILIVHDRKGQVGDGVGKNAYVGAGDGTAVGTGVGDAVGTRVGVALGDPVGREVGSDVGTTVGTDVGTDDGTAVGTRVGADVGRGVGSGDGIGLGAAIGNGEGGGLGKGEVGELVTVGCDVGARVYTSVDKMDTPLIVVTPRSFAREATADASVPSDAAFATSVSHVSESSPADDAVVN